MASPIRSHMHGEKQEECNNVRPLDPNKPILAVAPLNCVPYVDPSSTFSANIPPSAAEIETEAVLENEPAMVFLSSSPSKEHWNAVMAATKSGIGLTGSAAMGKVGPILGVMDIGESEDAYLFRVSLPGVGKENGFSCDIQPDGKIEIKGLTSTGERVVHKNSQIFEMLTQNLCPAGHFSVSFQLPGPVDYQQFRGVFGVDGILEGIVKKSLRQNQ